MNRSNFIKTLGILPLAAAGLSGFVNKLKEFPKQDVRQPVLFIGHGSPMNAIETNSFTQRLNTLGRELIRPQAILVISAHWLTRGTYVSSTIKPETIHDFGGFPQELFDVNYPAPGAPYYAKLTQDMVKNATIGENDTWGLDHGTWSVLKHIYPAADVPVFQLSIDYNKSMQYHYDLAAELKGLRNKGVLIIGSGNITHNLRNVIFSEDARPFDWAIEFDSNISNDILTGNHNDIINYEKWGAISRMAHPTNDHFLPLLYTIGLQESNEPVSFIFEGIQYGSLSMRCVKFG